MTQAVDSVTQSLPVSDETKQAVTDKAHEVQNRVGEQVRTQVGRQAGQAGDQIGAISTALHTTSRELRDQGQSGTAGIIEQAAEKGDQLSDYLANSDPSRILSDVEDFCRQQPWVVIAGGIALGFLGARFLKSSSSRRYDDRYGNTTGYYPGSYANRTYGPNYAYGSSSAQTNGDVYTVRSGSTVNADPLTAGTGTTDVGDAYADGEYTGESLGTVSREGA